SEVARLFAYDLSELQGQPVETLMPQAYRQQHVQLRQDYFTQSTPRFMGLGRDLFGQRKDGSQFPVEIGLRPLMVGMQQFVVASILDISERKKAHEQLATVIDSSPYGKLVVDKSGVIRLVNHRLVDLFGYSKEQLLGQAIEILLPERYRDAHGGLLQHYFAKPSLRAMGEGRDLTGRHRSGREIPIEIGLAPLDFTGELHVLVCITDITQRKRLESDLREANAQLEEFTFVVSHDLKSPMRGIADLTEWIIEDLGTAVAPSVANNLQRIQTRIARMENLTEDLLLYARAAKRSKEVAQVKLPDLIKGILELLVLPEQAQVHVHFAIPELITAKAPIETVLRNLISNAIKHHHAPESFQLSISAEPAGSYLCIRVQDNGPGIPPDILPHIFDAF
ncbi:MAG TPA: PAS domain S-box protein, partial [Cellvibrionaceae bacterium]|nr:PAS domain S-box protein [Cellvibrionaceae bacterium]